MKDQYVGDINDFAKYAILRSLRAQHQHLAVCWMRTLDDSGRDGRHLAYLNSPNVHRPLDPQLFDRLGALVRNNRRHLRAVERSRLLEPAVFFSEALRDPSPSRVGYFNDFWKIVPRRSLVFFDPDNGLDVPSVAYGTRNSSKYLYIHEVKETVQRQHSIVIYQHFPRVQRAPLLARLFDRLSYVGVSRPFALYTSRVAFLVCPSSPDDLFAAAKRLVERSNGLLNYASIAE